MCLFSFLRLEYVFTYCECVMLDEVRWLFHAGNTLETVVKISVLLETVIYKKVRIMWTMMLPHAV